MLSVTHLRRPALTVLSALLLAAIACDTSALPAPDLNALAPTAPADSATPTRPVNIGTTLPGSQPPADQPAGTAVGPTAAPSATNPPGDSAQVTSIVDGDTFKAAQSGAEVTVRYLGISTPEIGQPCADAAAAANQSLVGGQTVTLVKDVTDTDQFGRLLRYVYAGGVFVNAELVRQGWAEAVKAPPDVAHADEFHTLATTAREANLGCWPTGLFGPPASGLTLTAGASVTPTVTSPAGVGTAGTPGTPSPTATAGSATPASGSEVPVCDCSYNKYNCSDFATRADAQACFDYCVRQGRGDVHMLDTNKNGIACENIPG